MGKGNVQDGKMFAKYVKCKVMCLSNQRTEKWEKYFSWKIFSPNQTPLQVNCFLFFKIFFIPNCFVHIHDFRFWVLCFDILDFAAIACPLSKTVSN